MIFAFVDESGHPHPNDSCTRPVLAVVCIDARNLRMLNTELFHLKHNLLGKEQFEIEAKANHLLTRATFRNRPEKREFVEAFFEIIRGSLEQGEQVKLSGYGNFDLRQKNERPGRNPKTGEEIPISARRVVTFRPGQKLKSRVEAYAGPGQQ